MLFDYMGSLMGENEGKGRLAIHAGQKTDGNKDMAIRKGERVHLGRAQDPNLDFVSSIRRNDAVRDCIHVRLVIRVAVDQALLMELINNQLGLAEEVKLFLAGTHRTPLT